MSEMFPRRGDRVRRGRNTTRTQYYALAGGLDIVHPALTLDPGRALAMVNFEPWYEGGYRRIPGYERFDGQPKPSEASYVGFETTDITTPLLAIGDAITGVTSGATGEVCGLWDDSAEDAELQVGTDWMGVTKVVGTFVNGEDLNTGDYTINNSPVVEAAPNVNEEELWLFQAENNYRADIIEVPGAGRVRGVWQRQADIYAWRNNIGETVGVMHVASAAGWVTAGIVMADYIRFENAELAGETVGEGATITGGSSGATATIHRVILNGGSVAWDGAGEGYYVLTNVVGGPFTNGEQLESPALTRLSDADGANVTFAFSPDGIYRFINHNYFGGSGTYRSYGCNGIDPGFEIDENMVVSPILMPSNPQTSSGSGIAPTNTPFLVEEHRNHLFFMFPGGSLQHSIPGVPLNWQAFLGAGEFGLGDEGTSLNSVVGNALIVSTTRETRGLFGTGVIDWELKLIAEQSGSLLYGSKKIDTVYSLDDLGITSVARTQQFGDFISATISQQIQPILIAQRKNFNDSAIVRESNQFRMYFSDNSCLVMYVTAGSQAETEVRRRTAKNPAEFGFLSYDVPVKSIYNTDDETGKERTYFCTNDVTNEGFVFEDQIGKNFDGETISSYIRTAFNQVGSPSRRKKFRRVDLELNTPNQLTLSFQSDLSYSALESSSSVDVLDEISNIPTIDIVGGGGFWDISNWDEFQWDGQILTTARAELRGTGENISFLIFNETAFSDPWEMQGITLHYDMRRLQR